MLSMEFIELFFVYFFLSSFDQICEWAAEANALLIIASEVKRLWDTYLTRITVHLNQVLSAFYKKKTVSFH